MGPRSETVEAPFLAERLPFDAWRAVPSKLVGVVLADLDPLVRGAKPGQVAIEHRLSPVVTERRGERRRPRAADPGHLPGGRSCRDVVEVAVDDKHGGSALRPPARDPRIAVGRIADDREP